MSTRLVRHALCVVLAGTAACNASAPYGFHPATAASYAPHDLLGEVEIANASAGTAYDAIMRLRPTFITWQRNATSNERRLVYVDGTLMGGIEWLQMMPATDIHEVRLVTPLTGSNMYPLNNAAGAIVITTKNGFRR
ncbi:MAG: hypothetical protein ACJ79K_18370 [Gemmatimonadaceae bacterium]